MIEFEALEVLLPGLEVVNEDGEEYYSYPITGGVAAEIEVLDGQAHIFHRRWDRTGALSYEKDVAQFDPGDLSGIANYIDAMVKSVDNSWSL